MKQVHVIITITDEVPCRVSYTMVSIGVIDLLKINCAVICSLVFKHKAGQNVYFSNCFSIAYNFQNFF